MAQLRLQIPQELRRGLLRHREEDSVESGATLLSIMSKALGLQDLGSSSVLDMGCGCKFTQAILDRDIPMQRYVGVDVYAEMINFLQSNVDDARFDYHHMNTHNEMYNPTGSPLAQDTPLSLGDEKFDVICLFSVFTHLAPHDYVSMLKLLRRFIKPDGRLYFSVFIHEQTLGGFGKIDAVMEAFDKLGEEQRQKFNKHFDATVVEQGPADFIDFIPNDPLKVAMYSRKHALELFEGTGWEVESLNDPVEHIQHSIICKPA